MARSLEDFERDKAERERGFYDSLQMLRHVSQISMRHAEGAGFHILPMTVLNEMIDRFAVACAAESVDKFGYHPQIDEMFLTRLTASRP